MATVTTPPSQAPVNNLANQLTAARFVLAVVLFVLIAVATAWSHVGSGAIWWAACLVVFLVAAFTDWLDGYLARTYNLGSTLGRNLDPLVDKVLMCGAYISLLPLGSDQGWLYPWMVTIVVARELVITSLRSFIEMTGAHFGADWLGKLKMGFQCAALIAIFVTLISTEWLAGQKILTTGCQWIRDGLIYAAIVVTLLSGLQYLWRAASLLKE
jgi:CDP-diacylglycerol--glycerol-3-phosphate 3-phosphatidyltransferase